MVVFIHVCFVVVVVDLCVYTKKILDSPFCSIKLSAKILRIFATIFSGFMGAPRCFEMSPNKKIFVSRCPGNAGVVGLNPGFHS